MNFTTNGIAFKKETTCIKLYPLKCHTSMNILYAQQELRKDNKEDLPFATFVIKSYEGEKFAFYRSIVEIDIETKDELRKLLSKRDRVMFKHLPLWKQRELCREYTTDYKIPGFFKLVREPNCQHSDAVQDEPPYESPDPESQIF